jgi:hypothetical protein
VARDRFRFILDGDDPVGGADAQTLTRASCRHTGTKKSPATVAVLVATYRCPGAPPATAVPPPIFFPPVQAVKS